jgi:uncharacterized membrane protein
VTTTDERVPAGLTVERVGFFTDAVFAIAMTLLVIDIAQPEKGNTSVGPGVNKAQAAEHLLRFLYHQLASFYSYALAFFMLWILWREHHTLFDRLDRLSPRLVGLHFPMLLLIGFMPYVTSVNGHHSGNPAAAALFVLGFGALLICRSALQSRALRDGLLNDDVDLTAYRIDAQVSWFVTGYWLATLLLCWWTPLVGIAWALTSPIASVLTRLRTGKRPDGSAGSSSKAR